MQTTIENQIKAVQAVKDSFPGSLHPTKVALNDAASTLAAIKMILSGDIGAEFDKFTMYSNRANGQDFVDFLKQKGLPIK